MDDQVEVGACHSWTWTGRRRTTNRIELLERFEKTESYQAISNDVDTTSDSHADGE